MPDPACATRLKSGSVEEARANAIPILRGAERLGQLVPVGAWILTDKELISRLALWRARAMDMFLAQFESTAAKTEVYLREFSIAREDRILFMIETRAGFVGHVGLANIADSTAEVDNVMRGVPAGRDGLMSASERTLASWAFDNLDVTSLYLRVLSHNESAKILYERDGFVTTERLPLRREPGVDGTVLIPCESKLANVPFTCDVMTLDRWRFRSQILSQHIK